MPEGMPTNQKGDFNPMETVNPFLPKETEDNAADAKSVEVDPVYDAEAAMIANKQKADRKAAQEAARARVEAKAVEAARKKAQELGGRAQGYEISAEEATPGTGFPIVNKPKKKGLLSRLFG